MSCDNLAARGTPEQQARYLKFFRRVAYSGNLTTFHCLLVDQRWRLRAAGTVWGAELVWQAVCSSSQCSNHCAFAACRADSIVRDAELIRRAVVSGGRWSILGQSFGGFCWWVGRGLKCVG